MKGILFKPWKIQFIAEHPGIEIMTRRVIKPQPKRIDNAFDGTWEWEERGHYYDDLTLVGLALKGKSRYQQGETVYIKEKALYWVSPILEGVEYDKPSDWWTDCVYQDDAEIPALLADNGRLVLERSINQIVEGSPTIGKWEWKSGMFMPEHCARHFIVITGVGAERVQEIGQTDISMEGLELRRLKPNEDYYHHIHVNRMNFMRLWDSINKDYPFESNPWVWVYTFRLKGEK